MIFKAILDELEKIKDIFLEDLPFHAAFANDIILWSKGTVADRLQHLRTLPQGGKVVGIDLHQGWNHIGPKHNGGYPSTN
jgi:hypothetical protein